ncbi:hypothetical protein [Sediminitomix flava]|uniref:Uncharacterized protein n=1 Tax=Sediminitomix flava TaxID=379075 RepID=A0A315Z7V1_SEDFL|nr:hypothetical protein [Sediminitomix flava]PWJ40234.1 hypothetical protein BC781_105302 [Sediminitomix flava]
MRLAGGIFFIVLSIVLYFYSVPKLNKEFEIYEKAVTTTPFSEGDTVFINGKVSNTNPKLVKNLCIGSKEVFKSFGKYNGFSPIEFYVPEFLTVNFNSDSVKVNFKEIPFRGSKVTHIPLEEKTEENTAIRLKGLKANAPILLIGTVNEDQTVDVMYSFSGSLEEYQSYIHENGKGLVMQICGSVGLIGALLVILGIFGRKKKRKAFLS